MRKNIIIFLFPQDKRRILKIHLKFPKSKHTYQPLWVLKVLNIWISYAVQLWNTIAL